MVARLQELSLQLAHHAVGHLTIGAFFLFAKMLDEVELSRIALMKNVLNISKTSKRMAFLGRNKHQAPLANGDGWLSIDMDFSLTCEDIMQGCKRLSIKRDGTPSMDLAKSERIGNDFQLVEDIII